MDPSNTGEFSLDFEKGEDKYFDDYRYANIKYLSFPQFKDLTQNDKLILYQDFTLNKGGIFWDGSYLLIQYFLKFLHDEKKKDKWVLELGAGTSLPSIVLKLLGYKVVATDLKYLVEFVKKNVFLNIASDCDEIFINDSVIISIPIPSARSPPKLSSVRIEILIVLIKKNTNSKTKAILPMKPNSSA